MNIKERFTIFNNDTTGKTIVLDNENKEVISEVTAEERCIKDYGESFSEKSKFLSKTIDSIIGKIEIYNSYCPEGFDISYEDVIRKLNNKLHKEYLKDIMKADEKDGLYDEADDKKS